MGPWWPPLMQGAGAQATLQGGNQPAPSRLREAAGGCGWLRVCRPFGNRLGLVVWGAQARPGRGSLLHGVQGGCRLPRREGKEGQGRAVDGLVTPRSGERLCREDGGPPGSCVCHFTPEVHSSPGPEGAIRMHLAGKGGRLG